LRKIKEKVRLPLIADIHFDHRLALKALEAGVDGLRINPGTIGSRQKVKEVVLAAKERGIPIRIGINSGSLERDIRRQYGGATAQAMVASALRHVDILESLDYHLIKLSLKASDIQRTVDAYRLMAQKVDYPFHAGITEAGGLVSGAVKSSAGLALLLAEGLADTIRISLTAPPEEEVRVAYWLLASLGVRRRGVTVISCPTCGRCKVDLVSIASRVEAGLEGVPGDLTVAVMGCMVNGPGEAKEADIGIACGRGAGVLFQFGRPVRRLKEKEILPELLKEVKEMARKK
jgi:(E)-4-hydroxy-3-methylbut-2-enyl-diphosphate synthase